MQASRQEPQLVITRASHEKLQRKRATCIFLILVEGPLMRPQGVHKGARMETSLGIHKMEPHGRQVGILAILLSRIVGRKEACEDYRGVQHNKKHKPSRDCALYSQTLVSVRMRGSAQYRSRSARKLPPIRKSVERRTPPMTTYKSRARIASSKNGPSPGQLMSTSTRSDPLNSVPILNPKREISGFAAAGSAYR